MLNIKHSFILILAFAFAAVGCKKDDEPSSSETTKEEKVLTFEDVFGTPDKMQTWKYSRPANFDVYTPQGTNSLAFYYTYFGSIYKIASIDNPSAKESVYLNLPYDVQTVEVLVDWRRYTTDGSKDVDARSNQGESLPDAWPYYTAKPMAWLLAADSPKEADFDFNDLIARIVPNEDGGVDVTAMCSGSTENTWLHYTDGADDYIISPFAPNGKYVKTSTVRTSNALDYTWHQWFTDPDQGFISSGYAVNVGGSGNSSGRKGYTVSLPAELFLMGFDVEMLCSSNIKVENGTGEYNGTEYGFYVTIGVFDLARKKALSDKFDEEPSMAQAQMGIGPLGMPTQIFIIPDVPAPDVEGSLGWQWPTMGSRIDLVYPDFLNWVSNPSTNWFAIVPGGFPNRVASKDENGKYLNFGYYKR